jgi:hypothetical protein
MGFGSAVNPVLGAIVGLIGTGVTLKNLVQSETFYEFGGVVCQDGSLRETEILKKIAFAELFVDMSMCFTVTGRRDRTLTVSFNADLDALVASSGWAVLKGLFTTPMTALKVAAVKDVRAKFGTSATATLGCTGSSKTSLSKSVMGSIAGAFKSCRPSGSVAIEATLGAGVHSYLLSATFGMSVSTPKIPKGTKSLKAFLIALSSGLPVHTLKLAVSKNYKRIGAYGVGGVSKGGVNVSPDIVTAELMFNWEKPIYTCSLEVASGEFVKALLGEKPKFPASCAWNKPPSATTKSTKTTTATTTTATARSVGYSLGDGLRIRAEPTTQAETLGRLAKCASFEIVARNVAAVGNDAIKSWTKVKAGSLTGYVASSYVSSSACSK